jgi:hypothetical protein
MSGKTKFMPPEVMEEFRLRSIELPGFDIVEYVNNSSIFKPEIVCGVLIDLINDHGKDSKEVNEWIDSFRENYEFYTLVQIMLQLKEVYCKPRSKPWWKFWRK